nr:hypothetical protein [Tanacetum cinerariifolium]
MNYQPVIAGNQTNPSAGFQDKFDAEKAGEEIDQQYVLFPVCAAGPSNAAASPTHGKSSFIDASQHPNDPDMPELEDITYSDDEDDVGAEANFNNLETSITSPIESVTGYRDLNAEFEDYSENSSNEVNTASSTVPTVGKISLNSTNTFSAVGPSNDVVSPTYGKTSDINAS